jgi:DNA-binding NarL/FixJ family response regulator
MFVVRVVIVDDNPDFIESAVRFLADYPQIDVVGRAQSGREGLEVANQMQPDLVLMDLAMPGMNGLEAARALKNKPNSPRVVMLTLHDLSEYRAAGQAAGADGYVSKSDLGEGLLPLVDALFAERAIPERRIQS